MKCGCKDKTVSLKIEGNVDLGPIWCDKCGWNLRLDQVQISKELKSELYSWNQCYKNLINPETGDYIENWINVQGQYDNRGYELAERVQMELKEWFIIRFEGL